MTDAHFRQVFQQKNIESLIKKSIFLFSFELFFKDFSHEKFAESFVKNNIENIYFDEQFCSK